MKASLLIDPEGRARLERVVAEAERNTGGEIVIAVVSACDEYGSAGWRFGVALAALIFLALGLFVSPLPWTLYLVAQALGVALGHALGRIPTIRRLLLSSDLVMRRVEQRATRAFGELGLARTRDRTGILILAALLERRVVVLADVGIHSVLSPDENWQQVVDLAVAGLRNGRAVDGLEAAARRCGEILAHHLPATTDNPNELPHALVVLED
jgi:putative membrane protein